eukprot:421020-Pyramimonas_sp.AAC.1
MLGPSSSDFAFRSTSRLGPVGLRIYNVLRWLVSDFWVLAVTGSVSLPKNKITLPSRAGGRVAPMGSW